MTQSVSWSQMDNVLIPYLSAKDEQDRQVHLDELLILRAGPLIRNVLLRRLAFHVSARGANQNNQDAEDLYQEAMTRVVYGLTQLQSSPGSEIENFELYVSRIAANICTDFLRAKSPARTRLKYSLRDLLKRNKDLDSWEHYGEIICGFAIWRNARKCPFSEQPFSEVEPQLESFKSIYFEDTDLRQAPLSQTVADFFHWVGGPVELEVLVQSFAYLLEVRDPEIRSLDDPAVTANDVYLIGNTQPAESHLAANELLGQLWQAVIQLPAEQRDAFAFGFKDEVGQDFFSILLAGKIVNWDELARGMDRSVEELIRLRIRMPMDAAGVAQVLGASRENVHKWRFRALRRLKAQFEQ